jgi:sulfate transport system ATP-binding protein
MIRLQQIRRTLGANRVLDGVDLTIEAGSFTALLGPSGSGKTTLLRMIAGLEPLDSGTIEIDGTDAATLKPGARRIGFVFQSYALFGHMTVFENIAFGLRVKPRGQVPGKVAIRETVERLLAMTRLDGLGPRLPQQLSGGQRQRVALARALAIEPRILLLDEPFGALDQDVRQALRQELRRLHDALGLTTVFVTHDEQEAEELADRVVRFDHGRIVGDMITQVEASAFFFEKKNQKTFNVLVSE